MGYLAVSAARARVRLGGSDGYPSRLYDTHSVIRPLGPDREQKFMVHSIPDHGSVDGVGVVEWGIPHALRLRRFRLRLIDFG